MLTAPVGMIGSAINTEVTEFRVQEPWFNSRLMTVTVKSLPHEAILRHHDESSLFFFVATSAFPHDIISQSSLISNRSQPIVIDCNRFGVECHNVDPAGGGAQSHVTVPLRTWIPTLTAWANFDASIRYATLMI